MDFKRHVECFINLLDNPIVQYFMKKDRCAVIVDKYHLAIIFQFFMRAGFQKEDYIVQNFFLALSVSHDIYDDVNVAVKNMVVRYYLKAINDKSHTRKEYQRSKLQLLQRMQYRTFVQKKICKNIISLIPHKFMERNRHELHAGAFNESNKVLCKKCLLPIRKSKEVEQRNSTVLNKHSR